MSDHSHLAALPVLLLALAYAASAPSLRSRPGARRRRLDRFAHRVQLPVPDHLRPTLERQLRGVGLGADLGGAAAVAMLSVWGLTLARGVVGGNWWPPIVFAGATAGAAVGAGVAAVREAARPRDDDGPRVARPLSPSLADYVAPVELQGGRVVALLPAVLLVIGLVLDAGDAAASGLLGASIATGCALSALAFGEIGGRRVLDVPQAAGSGVELAWSDAIRAHTLRAVVTVPVVAGTYASLGVLSTFVDLSTVDPRSPLGIALVGLLLALAGAAIVAGLWSATGTPHRYFRRRLWPNGGAFPRSAPTGGRR